MEIKQISEEQVKEMYPLFGYSLRKVIELLKEYGYIEQSELEKARNEYYSSNIDYIERCENIKASNYIKELEKEIERLKR